MSDPAGKTTGGTSDQVRSTPGGPPGDPAGRTPGAGRAVHDTRANPEQLGRDIHAMNNADMAVYEAIATIRRPMSAGDVAAQTGLDQDDVRASLDRLVERGIVVEGDDGVRVGPNDWDVWGSSPE